MSKVLVWREGEGEGRVQACLSKVFVWREGEGGGGRPCTSMNE